MSNPWYKHTKDQQLFLVAIVSSAVQQAKILSFVVHRGNALFTQETETNRTKMIKG